MDSRRRIYPLPYLAGSYGNIQAENAARVNVYAGSSVGGSIQIVQSGAADIQSVEIDSDLYFDDNNLFLNATNNPIGGNLQAFQNIGGTSITGNTIDGHLQCKENFPPPTGGGNIVKGSFVCLLFMHNI
jgi:hypothetical protein